MENRNQVETSAPVESYFSLYPAWCAEVEAQTLLDEVTWESHFATIMGRRVRIPRLTAFQGSPSSLTYRYSGTLNKATPWCKTVAILQRRLLCDFGTNYNCALLNLYRDGQDSNGWHADDEREGVPHTPIASISLGAQRRFGLRPKKDKNNKNAVFLDLRHGDLLIMKPGCQDHLKHSIPKTARPTEARINITFRVFADPPD